MKHLAAWMFAILLVLLGVGFAFDYFWLTFKQFHPGNLLLFVALGCIGGAMCLVIPADVGKALETASPILDRLPLPAIARRTIAQRVSQSVAAIPEDKP